MATNFQTGNDSSMTGLISGIIGDVQGLIQQQLALFKQEIRSDFRKAKEGALSLSVGFGVGILGSFMICLMLVHLLQWLWPGLPLWGCYGLVGALLLILGVAFCYAAKKTFENFNPIPEQSVEALKENMKWITKAK